MAIKDLASGRSDIFQIDPRKLHIKPNWNNRDMNAPDNVEHIDMLAKSISEIGVKEPLTAYFEDGKAYISNGHCRLLASIRAIEVYKSELKTVPVRTEDRYSSDADRILGQIVRNSGKAFSQMEQAKVFKKLIDLGWQQDDIAKKAGLSAGRISQILGLLTLPAPVQQMVVRGEVSPTLAQKTVAAAATPSQAEKALREGLQTAHANGASAVKPAHMPAEAARQPNIRALVHDAFEHSDVDNNDDDFVVIKMPTEHWELIRDALKL